jgi:hypothetical protein
MEQSQFCPVPVLAIGIRPICETLVMARKVE